ncbi:hypothetical protein [Lacipirellula parvula]|uniref:Uncharacterized protein n=1 Tax=Lacipirellula parvula TaxID=2650471 RepID=A0A5K7X5K4_9BACT|nr:hypothetical protein [Lacipirellula parvula]BBO32004.1 hypothetical protein PLANPX_1616 [Lacipirellula parvula]
MSRTIHTAVALAALLVGGSIVAAPQASASTGCCLPPVTVTLRVDDPCDPCPAFPVTVCVPGGCDESPCVSWRNGAFGRRVATYTWRSTGHQVEVVITRRGEVIIR